MDGQEKTVDQLVQELSTVRQRLADLEARSMEIRFPTRKLHETPVEQFVQDKTREIARSRDLLQGILNSSTLVSIVLTDLDQNVLYWNTGAKNIFGYEAEEILGRKITQLYPEDGLAAETVEQLRALVGNKTGAVTGKMKQIAKNGSVLTISLALSPMVKPSGEVGGILGVGLDITEEERQRQEVLRLLDLVTRTQEVTIFSLARLAESRDEETGTHLERIKEYSRVLCLRMEQMEQYREIVTAQYTKDLVQSSVLHDIGKVGVPDSVLMFHGKFTPEQREIMTQHTIIGGRALEEAAKVLGEQSFLTLGMEVAYYHHEKWDGSGYPFGLKGEGIPLSARILAIADVYDALTSTRRYKGPFSHDDSMAMIIDGSGRHFDPDLVGVLKSVEGEFRRIKELISDPD